MPDNKTGNQDKQQQPMKKPEQPQEREGGMGKVSRDLDKDVGNENRKVGKDLDTDETDEGENLDEQGEITQRNPRVGEDSERR